MKIGLTGGIGCGKSTVSKLFRERGFCTIDADAIVHELLSKDEATIEAVVALFGEAVRSPSGGIDRAEVGQRVFGDADLLSELEGILHPKVRSTWEAAAQTGGDWLVEIPLLFEKKLQKNVDITICVFSDPQTQVERLEQRGMNRTQALARMKRQMPVSEKAELADFVLLNDGSLEFLAEQVDHLISNIKNLQIQ
ncbi:dephospho-CoA kinase [Pelagicoccus sp. NFK12]|uniref:Dephospho-CoA kinase n=1 Tax=Pelagicoccus enzymogenes TaxID=2773457 RepID=A0A927F830_9BACT|nr:dephospho-CoA kinase [Pelagicoccus enzymogenes]MBD5778971.1 dephospho-CoA kinase [Pelagicoccus enzymogenes]MDQ8197285.1 dephospho-CoA kinase [Pelagicoccus enzymogenes]